MSRHGPLAFSLAAVGLSGILVLAVLWGVPHVEHDLEARVVDAVAEADFNDIGVAVDGRNVTLYGRAERDIEPQLRAALADVDGVRSIEARISRLERSSDGSGG